MGNLYSDEETNNLKRLFDIFDSESTGHIEFTDMQKVLEDLGTSSNELISDVPSKNPGRLDFEEFLSCLSQIEKNIQPLEQYATLNDFSQQIQEKTVSADSRVLDFLSLLEEYRIKCEQEGNYVEAKKANQKHKELQKKETIRQLNLMKIRQEKILRMLEEAQETQKKEFATSWETYLAEYETSAYESLQKLKEKHAKEHLEFREKSLSGARKKIKYSKELLELRRKEQQLVRQKHYEEAQAIRKQAGELESWEDSQKEAKAQKIIVKLEKQVRKQQELALSGLLKRIERDRMEQLKHREADAQKLSLRNRNILNGLILKQNEEAKRALGQLKKDLQAATGNRSVI